MSNMREWLDRKQFETSRFSIKGAAGRFVVHIRFKITEEAVAFAKHFAGRVL